MKFISARYAVANPSDHAD